MRSLVFGDKKLVVMATQADYRRATPSKAGDVDLKYSDRN